MFGAGLLAFSYAAVSLLELQECQQDRAQSDVARHLTSLEAGGADVQALWCAFHDCAHALNIRVPAAGSTHV